ncbi:galactose oxidase-like domain-containing protein [Prosthecomicrobium hirschii]|uniref:galactose oxidase-like domain-containing protein n=1 Tax=Prosthecodimorpha hirschii TaxID=665126 RepID=UPI002220B6CF|nr:galactose oxidase-like domain-containing protein [Prosthecomicrobium hirschii]MCW1840415.1 DUF1929 domain-containing protein [Prosthecomicrobium hirschii]
MKPHAVRNALLVPVLIGAALATTGITAASAASAGDPLVAGLAIPATAPTLGLWSPVKGWPLVGLHAALMPSGVVMTYGSPTGAGPQDGRTFDLWDPAKGLDDPAAHYTLPNAQSIDSFCSAASLLTSGSMLITGGSSTVSGLSPLASTIFNPRTNTPTALAATLKYPRWYGTMITLQDGRVVVVGGGKPYVTDAYKDVAGSLSRNDVSMIPEIYTPGAGWSALGGAASQDAAGPDLNRWWYPRLWVAPNGKVFGLSAEKMWSLDVSGAGKTTTLGTFKSGYDNTTKPNVGPTSTAVMFDIGRILQVGGNGAANGAPTASSAAASIIDIRGAKPVVAETAAMANPRQWANSTVLPNGRVLVTGGTRFGDNAGTDAVYGAEIWDPATGRWTAGASASVYRGYHSAAILLPNGSILSTGGGLPGPARNFNAEIYYPPYLFTTVNGTATLAPRPSIKSLNASGFAYGAQMTITLDDASRIARVALIGLSSTTHSFNTGQRFIPVSFRQSGTKVTVSLPAQAHVAPPGYYMFFLSDQAGVPSQGRIVALGGSTATPPSAPEGGGVNWVAIGNGASRISHGADGTTVAIDAQAGTLWTYAGDNSWTQIKAPVAMTDVAVVSRTSLYAIGADRAVYRYNGAAWAAVGQNALSVGAASDGTVVVTRADNSIWRKSADDNGSAWKQTAGRALRVAPQSASRLWMIGLDKAVYGSVAGATWFKYGTDARDLAVAPDGYLLVSSANDSSLWGRDSSVATSSWTAIQGSAQSVAMADDGVLMVVAPNGTVYRR